MKILALFKILIQAPLAVKATLAVATITTLSFAAFPEVPQFINNVMPNSFRHLNTKILKQAFEAVSPQAESVQDDILGVQDDKRNQGDDKGKQTGDRREGAVLAESTTANPGRLDINIPAFFNDPVSFNSASIFSGGLKVEGSSQLNLLTVNGAATFNENLTAPNVIYSLLAGTGIGITSGQTPTITNTGVTSLQGSTGALTFTAGSGMTISGLTITNNDKGTDQKIFKTISDGSTSFSAGSNTDTLTFAAGSGLSLSIDTSNKKVTFSGSSSTTAWTLNSTSLYPSSTTYSIGIGNTSPSYKLDVTGTGRYTSQLLLTGVPSSSASGGGSLYINPASATADYTLFGVSVGGTEKLRIDAEGDIHIQGSIISTTPGTVGYWSRASTNTYLGNSGDLVGLGTSAPAAGLEVVRNGAASLSGGLFSGTWFTGGTATTTKPQLLIEPTSITSNTWSTSGTALGINGASGFVGNLIDAKIAGGSGDSGHTSKFKVDYNGNITFGTNNSGATLTGNVQNGGSFIISTGYMNFISIPNSGSPTLTSWTGTNINLNPGSTGGVAVSSSATTGSGLSVATNSLTTGNALSLSSTSTAGGASGTSYLLNLSRSGANAQLAHTAYGVYSSVTNTNATSGTNIAGYFSASGATTANYGIYSAAGINYFNGNVGVGTTSPVGKLDVTDTSNTAASYTVINNTATTIGAGANTLGVLDLQSTSLTTGTFMNMELNALTSGKGINLTSTSTALTTGNLISLDWSPSSTQSTAATGNLFNINIGANATNFAGNLFNVADASSSIFSVSKTSVTTSLPVNITASGDSTFAYDINMTNPTASFVKSLSALTLQAGESFNSSDLTLKTYNQGSVVVDSAVTTGTGVDIQNTTLTTGYGLSFTGPSSTGITGSALYAASDIGSAGKLLNLAPDFSGSAVTGYGIYNAGTDSTANANTDYGYYGSLALTGNAAKNGYGIYQTVTSSSTTADTIYAANLATSVTGIMTTGTRNVYGLYSNPSAGAESTGGTTNVYGGYFKADADVAAGGTVNGYGLYIANGAFDTDGTSTQYGLYVAEPTGADTNYAIYSAGGVNYFSGQLQAGSGTVGAPSYSFSAAGVTDAGMYNPIGAALGFVADGGEVLRLASPTQVRLGTSTLAWGTNLGGEDVILLRDAANILAQRNGTTAQTQRLYNTYTDASNYERAELNWASNANVFTLQTTAAGTGTVRNIALMGGNVGIGTTAPSSKLDVTTAGLGVTQTTSSGLALVNTTAAAAGAQQMSPAIRWSGFGWKTDATAASQSVDFRAFVTPVQGTANPTGFLGFGSSINGGAYSDNQLVLTSGGNVGIGTTAPVAPFEVKASGTGVIAKFTSTNTTGCTLADGGTISCTSDRNFKKNIANLPYGLDTLMALNPVEFNWNSQENGSQKTLGFIAQEVETVVPNLVMTDPSNGQKQLNTIGLVPVLAKALQELNHRVNNLTLSPSSQPSPIKGEGDNTIPSPLAGEGQVFDSEGLSPQAQTRRGEGDAEATLSAKLATLESKINNLEASLSAVLANNVILSDNEGSLADASSSAETSSEILRSAQNDTSWSDLIAQAATASANLSTPSPLTGEGWGEGDLTISNTLKSLGKTYLGDTTIAGNFSVDGTMSISGSSINSLSSDITCHSREGGNLIDGSPTESGMTTEGNDNCEDTLGILYIQDSPLASVVDFFNGKVKITKEGTISAQKIETSKLVIARKNDEAISLGTAKLLKGTNLLVIKTTAVTQNSKILITALEDTPTPLYVTDKVPGESFTVKIRNKVTQDIDFDWLIIDSK